MPATPSAPFDLSTFTVGLHRNGSSSLEKGGGRPGRVDGFVVGAPVMTRSAPHAGELHPDGDGLLTWHRVVIREPSHLLHVTPGPGGDHRPLRGG